jgi:hypothetical protein
MPPNPHSGPQEAARTYPEFFFLGKLRMKEKEYGWVGFFKANPLFAPILVFLFVIALVTAPFHPEVCPNHEDYPCKDPIRYNFLFGLVAYLNTYSGAVIAVFTGTLWFSTRRQAILTRDIAS